MNANRYDSSIDYYLLEHTTSEREECRGVRVSNAEGLRPFFWGGVVHLYGRGSEKFLKLSNYFDRSRIRLKETH